MPDKTITEIVKDTAPYIWFSSFWGVAIYLHQLRKWKTFSLVWFIINAIMAWWLWGLVYLSWVLDSFTVGMQVTLISITWYLAYPILDLIEEKWLDLLIKKLLWQKR